MNTQRTWIVQNSGAVLGTFQMDDELVTIPALRDMIAEKFQLEPPHLAVQLASGDLAMLDDEESLKEAISGSVFSVLVQVLESLAQDHDGSDFVHVLQVPIETSGDCDGCSSDDEDVDDCASVSSSSSSSSDDVMSDAYAVEVVRLMSVFEPKEDFDAFLYLGGARRKKLKKAGVSAVISRKGAKSLNQDQRRLYEAAIISAFNEPAAVAKVLLPLGVNPKALKRSGMSSLSGMLKQAKLEARHAHHHNKKCKGDHRHDHGRQHRHHHHHHHSCLKAGLGNDHCKYGMRAVCARENHHHVPHGGHHHEGHHHGLHGSHHHDHEQHGHSSHGHHHGPHASHGHHHGPHASHWHHQHGPHGGHHHGQHHGHHGPHASHGHHQHGPHGVHHHGHHHIPYGGHQHAGPHGGHPGMHHSGAGIPDFGCPRGFPRGFGFGGPRGFCFPGFPFEARSPNSSSSSEDDEGKSERPMPCRGPFGRHGHRWAEFPFGGRGPMDRHCFWRGRGRGCGREALHQQRSYNEAQKRMARLVMHKNMEEGTKFDCGTDFEKGWVIRNDSSDSWPHASKLVHVGGDILHTEATRSAVVPPLGPGQQTEISIGPLHTPELPGLYRSFFRLQSMGDDAANTPFGQRLRCSVFAVDRNPETRSDSNASGAIANSDEPRVEYLS